MAEVTRAFAELDAKRAVPLVRARVNAVTQAIDANRASLEIYARTAERGWYRVANEKECWVVPEDVGQDYEHFPSDCAAIWRVKREVVRVHLGATSPSGDWFTRVEYTFWPGGVVAFRFEEQHPQICNRREREWDPEPDGCRHESRRYRDEQGRLVRDVSELWIYFGDRREKAPEDTSFNRAELPDHLHLQELKLPGHSAADG